jgi:hypothetical protein
MDLIYPNARLNGLLGRAIVGLDTCLNKIQTTEWILKDIQPRRICAR